MKYSQYQLDIFNWVENNSGNGAVNAVAGSGKTTSLEHALRRIDRSRRVGMFAFNKAIAEVIDKRVNGLLNIDVYHFHKWGNSLCRKNLGFTNFNQFKVWNKLRLVCNDEQEYESNKINVQSIISKMKGLALNEPSLMKELIDHYDITVKDFDRFRVLVQDTWNLSIKDKKTLDYDDMIYFPVRFGWVPLDEYDFVMVDEFQDINLVQTKLSLIGKRNLVVGDPDQAIYGFRGTSRDAFGKFVQELNAKELPLSICYRCPKRVVQLAQQIVPKIEYSEFANEGIVEDNSMINMRHFFKEGREGLIICRCTAPLVSSVLWFIRNNIPAYVKGKEVGFQLIGTINTISEGEESLELFIGKMREWFDERRKYLELMNKDTINLEDQQETLEYLISETNIKTISGLINKIKEVFPENGSGIPHMTIHKSKGLEANNVFLIKPELIPHKKAKKDWQKEEEMRLKYVAITRSMDSLYWVRS